MSGMLHESPLATSGHSRVVRPSRPTIIDALGSFPPDLWEAGLTERLAFVRSGSCSAGGQRGARFASRRRRCKIHSV
jgi:hypothetical protein